MRGLFKTIFMTALLGGVAGPVAAQDAGPVYAAKMVCGFQPDPEALQLVQGVYATVVNLLNISGSKQSVIVTFAMAHPPSAPMPGGGYDVAEVTLAPGQAAAVDCEDLAALTFPFGFPDTYIDGFVLIAGQGPLTVRAVYTAAPFEKDGCCQGHPGQVASIDVERIEAVPMAEGTEPLPDLLPEAPVRSQDPQGQPGTGFCGQVQRTAGHRGRWRWCATRARAGQAHRWRGSTLAHMARSIAPCLPSRRVRNIRSRRRFPRRALVLP